MSQENSQAKEQSQNNTNQNASFADFILMEVPIESASNKLIERLCSELSGIRMDSHSWQVESGFLLNQIIDEDQLNQTNIITIGLIDKIDEKDSINSVLDIASKGLANNLPTRLTRSSQSAGKQTTLQLGELIQLQKKKYEELFEEQHDLTELEELSKELQQSVIQFTSFNEEQRKKDDENEEKMLIQKQNGKQVTLSQNEEEQQKHSRSTQVTNSNQKVATSIKQDQLQGQCQFCERCIGLDSWENEEVSRKNIEIQGKQMEQRLQNIEKLAKNRQKGDVMGREIPGTVMQQQECEFCQFFKENARKIGRELHMRQRYLETREALLDLQHLELMNYQSMLVKRQQLFRGFSGKPQVSSQSQEKDRNQEDLEKDSRNAEIMLNSQKFNEEQEQPAVAQVSQIVNNTKAVKKTRSQSSLQGEVSDKWKQEELVKVISNKRRGRQSSGIVKDKKDDAKRGDQHKNKLTQSLLLEQALICQKQNKNTIVTRKRLQSIDLMTQSKEEAQQLSIPKNASSSRKSTEKQLTADQNKRSSSRIREKRESNAVKKSQVKKIQQIDKIKKYSDSSRLLAIDQPSSNSQK